LLAELGTALFISGCGGADGTATDTVSALQAPSSASTTVGIAGSASSSSAGASDPAAPPSANVVGTGSAPSCTEAALEAALLAGGTVTFNCGGAATIAITSPKAVSNTVTVDGGTVITLSGNLQSRLFDVAASGVLTLQNITLDQAFGAADGAAIANHGTLTLSQVTISGAIAGGGADGRGGAIYTDGPRAEIDGCTFVHDTAGSGGAIFLDTAAAVVNVSNSSFIDNSAQSSTAGYGGAIQVNPYAHLSVFDTVFFGNRADKGGAIFVSPNGVVDITGSPFTPGSQPTMQFNANSAIEAGGAIYNQGPDLAIANTLLSGNSTNQEIELDGFGGAIANAGSMSLLGSIVSGNQARFGGGVWAGTDGTSGSNSTSVDSTAFNLNSTTRTGAGLYTDSPTASVYINNSTFDSNSAGNGGGGVGRYDSDLHIATSSFTNNTAAYGGGLYIVKLPGTPYEPTVPVQSVTVSGNSASFGGGVYNSAAVIEMSSMTVTNNTTGVFTDFDGDSRFRSTTLRNPGYVDCATGPNGGLYSDDGHNSDSDGSCGFVTRHCPPPTCPPSCIPRCIREGNPVRFCVALCKAECAC
jgi:predicted outer membrane repeat protein